MTSLSMGAQRWTAALLVLGLLLVPAVASAAPVAQEGTLDPAVVETIHSAAIIVAQSAGLGGAAAVSETVVPVETPTEEPTEEPTEVPAEAIIPDPDNFVEFQTGGLSMLVPDNWKVEEGTDGSELATFTDEPTGIDGQLQDFGADFPGLMVFPIFEGQAGMLVDSLGDEAALTGVSRVELEQGLPALRIGFANAQNDDQTIDGAIYIIATGDNAYGFFAGSDPKYWGDLAPVVDAIAESILLDDDLVTLQQAGDEGLTVDDPNGEYSVTVPAGWYISPAADSDLRMVVGDPGVLAVGALAVKSDVGTDDETLKALTEAIAGSLPEEEAQGMIEDLLSEMDLSSDGGVTIDTTLTSVLPSSGDAMGTIRFGGNAEVADGLSLPIIMYLSVYTDKVAGLIVFGEHADVQAQEASLLQILDSMTFNQ